MNTPRTKQPTKKAFHFPKSAEAPVVETVKSSAKTPKVPATKKAIPAKGVTNVSKTPKAKQAAATASEKEMKEEKARRPKKDKVVRDSFTMPKSDYEKIAELKQRCLEAGVSVKKSELLRAGLDLLIASSAKRLVATIAELDAVKTGRPARS
ncbi:MAG TPA: hypothetical protein VGL08_01750 [Paraburkholderia sp.]|jgi:hypothetical protein